MVKFLSGNAFSGDRTPICTFWRSDVRTDVTQDFAALQGTGVSPDLATADPESPSNQCIANAFFVRSAITCFNEGRCNGSGKCLPCSKYKYGGMRLGITHSPPPEFLRQFDKGLTDEQIRSPNLAAFPPEAINLRQRDQLPLHALYKNIMAQIAKCCHWNSGDGLPGNFVLTPIISGPDTATIKDEAGNDVTLQGIIIKNPVFPDEVGTFFPVGTPVVAGFEGQLSFYLEPRTGLAKPGDGIIFGTSGDAHAPLVRMKQAATACTQPIIDTVNATITICTELTQELDRQSDFFDNAFATEVPTIIAAAQVKLTDITNRKNTACAAASSAETLGNAANVLVGEIVNTSDPVIGSAKSKELALKLNSLADTAESAINVSTGRASSDTAALQIGNLRRCARNVQFAGFRSFSKCEFFFEEGNGAAQWNNPQDGTIPCNGIRTDCQFYTGAPWQFATDEKLDIGKRVTAEALQEIRFRSDEWDRFFTPAEEFRNRFSTPFIWAFDRYVDVAGSPEISDLILYKPKTLFLKDTDTDLPSGNFQTIQVQKTEITNFDTLTISKSAARIQPGHVTLDLDRAPQFPSLISQATVPSVSSLKITHPTPERLPFIYRIWSPDKNRITLFGKATPDATIYLVNNTSLLNRQRYHDYLGTKDLVSDLPTALPGAPSFVGISASALLAVFSKLEDEKRLNNSEAPLGFDKIEVGRNGSWQSIQEVDLVHNEINTIFAFIVFNDFQFIFDSTQVDCRFLHALPIQTSFRGKDFSLNSSATGGGNKFGAASGDVTKGGRIEATTQQIVGNESTLFSYGYMGWRFKDRGLRFGTLGADDDLQGEVQISDTDATELVIETDASEFITGTTYHVVQYRKEDVEITNWYLVDDCGSIMIEIPDAAANRVLPLPNQQGVVEPLQNVLLNGGSVGAVVAQFGLLGAKLQINDVEKSLVQIYRDPDGFGLPANYVLLGPRTEVENAFGRPIFGRDTITISYTYLQAQTATKEGIPEAPTNSDTIVTNNFYADNLRPHTASFEFETTGNLIAGTEGNNDQEILNTIRQDQQDYVWVFSDSDGRPLGRKVTRMMLMYYNLAAINVEMFYAWVSSCTTYGLIPDLNLQVGQNDGTLTLGPKGTIDPGEMQLGFRVANLLGEFECNKTSNCGDHEFLSLGPLRREFEVIVETQDSNPDGTPAVNPDGTVKVGLKAAFPSAGGIISGNVVSTEPPGSQFLKRRGPLWYPYTVCERPRYDFRTNGPLHTDSTELINTEVTPPGISITSQVIRDDQVSSAQGVFGLLPRQDQEAYRGPDRVVPKILDIHPSLRPCVSAYTYGNQVMTGKTAAFSGAARRRGEIDIFWYEGLQWAPPPLGNFGRPKLIFEVADKRGDFLGGPGGQTVGFRWMPMFPEREDLGATIELFSEEMESQHYRFVQTKNPVSELSEVVNPLTRFTHKELIQNKVSTGIEYPYIAYYPTFLPDSFLGVLPEDRGIDTAEGAITTMWAWREQERAIKRGQSGPDLLTGITFESPDYFLDQRRLEIQLRPDEGLHSVAFRSPTYDQEDGSLLTNAALRLDTGPERQIIIDFINKELKLAIQANTLYDTSLDIGSEVFGCEDGTPSDNPLLQTNCSCIPNINDPELQGPPVRFASRFLHLDSVAPEGFFALYESTQLNTPFSISIPRETSQDPCCMCVYYIRGIFFKLDLEFLPTSTNIDPAFDSRLPFKYTWSRPPHGLIQGEGTDGIFSANEDFMDNYIDYGSGQVFVNRFTSELTELSVSLDAAAIFPGSTLALQARSDGTPISVINVDVADLHNNGIEATDRESLGEDEVITLDFLFETYVKVKSVIVTFFAGNGWQVPKFRLGVIDPQFRGAGANDPTVRTARIVAESTVTTNGLDVPFSNLLNTDAIREGLPGGVGARFAVTIVPSYNNMSFWNQFGMEFHLIFDPRGNNNSMGIASIEMEVEAIVGEAEKIETIFTPERKYYISTGIPSAGNNPEQFLEEAESATAYWRQTDLSPKKGANKFRAYGFGEKIEDNQGPLRGDPRDLENLQEEEYNKSRELMPAPYEFIFQAKSPVDEENAIQFYEGTLPTASLLMTLQISTIDEIRQGGSGNRLYGQVPTDRNPWHAPGHAWTFKFVENYLFCCFPCPKAMTIDYNFAHLHDGLAVVETARFWDELPTGFNRLIRSTLMSPDPTFGQRQESGLGIDGGTTGQAVLLEAGNLVDSQGNPISVETLENAGFRKDENGNFIIIGQGGE